MGELVAEVRGHIENEYATLWVQGEISNLRSAPSGHLYFTLKDGEAQLPAVLFRRQAWLLRFRPQDGLEVILRGKVSVYEQRGQMQLVAEALEPVGAGSLQLAFEQLKQKLRDEGLFDEARKRALPAFPRCVGIITSPSGAVIRDFLNVAGRRHAALDVLLYPAVVQGETAAAEAAAGIRYFNQAKTVDVIVLARGGGSLEDLAPYNSESLARAIAASELPVVSAIGHDTDFTISDFAADLRAPTPSAAAEIITAAQDRIGEHVAQLRQRLERGCRYRLMQARERYTRLHADAALARMRDGLNRRQQRVDEMRFRMDAAWRALAARRTFRAQQLGARLARQDTLHRLGLSRERLGHLDQRLRRGLGGILEADRHRLRSASRQLAALSPLAVLGRGYAVVFDQQGRVLRNPTAARPGDSITARLAEGSLKARVTESNEDGNQQT